MFLGHLAIGRHAALARQRKIRIGLWNSLPATMTVELSMLAAGIAVYVRVRRDQSQRTSKAFCFLIILLLLIQLGNWFGPPPEGTLEVAVVGQAQWLLIAWAWWSDRLSRPNSERPD